MALADRLENPQRNMAGTPCSVGLLLDTLQGGELDALQQMLASREWSQAMVWKALTDEGYEVGMQSVNRHRGEKCRCVRDRR
jgi:hypothetical protein